jgi:hypothetical protein
VVQVLGAEQPVGDEDIDRDQHGRAREGGAGYQLELGASDTRKSLILTLRGPAARRSESIAGHFPI